MKKVLVSIFLFLFSPFIVQAADYKITNQLIEANIQENGDLLIKELIVMDGSFNGYEKSLSYANSLLNEETYANNSIYNASGLSLIDIKGKYITGDVTFATMLEDDFLEFNKVNYASNGDIAKYTEYKDTYGYTYRLYYHASNKKVAFLITYRVNQVVVMHEDVAELYWNFLSPNDYDDIKNVQVKVILPNTDLSDNFRIWAHGDLSGEIKKLEDNSGAIATIDYMDKSSVLDIRLTFDKSLITDTINVKKSNDTALPGIIEVEEERAEIANNLREQLLQKYNLVFYGTIIFYIFVVVLTIYIYKKYGSSPKSEYYSKYNREFIDDYNVEIVDYLMNRKITPNAMSASIMNLVYKKNLQVEEIPTDKKKKEYTFILENMDNLNDSEVMLIEFLFDTVGKQTNVNNQKTFTTIQLKSYASGTKTCDAFIKSYTRWKNDVLEKGKKEEFFIHSNKPALFGVIMLIFAMFLVINAINYQVDFIPSYFIIIVIIPFFIYTLVVYKKTQKGALHYDKWLAFKNFLKDFGSFELKELPEIVLWERYLVYATIFGLADQVQKNMNVRIQELDMTSLDANTYPYFYIDLAPSINHSINNAISSAYSKQAANYANTHSSSSSGGGFGGGFSSGGGFGGGGSSGHGF